MLSNVDIIKELNKNIFIYPLITKNIKGSTVNLTASKWAWSLKTKSSIVQSIDGKNVIVIPAKDTALIETEEVIHVTQKIAGTYHSKVGLVSHGLSHIGTTLDPMFCGNSLIAIHNNSENNYTLVVGKSFVSLIFYYLQSESDSENSNEHGQTSILGELNITNIPDELREDWRKTPKGIKDKCKTDDNEIKKINKLKSNISLIERFFGFFRSDLFLKTIAPAVVSSIVAVIFDRFFNIF